MRAARVLALVVGAAMFVAASSQGQASLGYAAAFQSRVVMGTRSATVDFATQGWRDVDSEFSISLWSRGIGAGSALKPDVDNPDGSVDWDAGAIMRLVTADNNWPSTFGVAR